jgi:hypothetical protein
MRRSAVTSFVSRVTTYAPGNVPHFEAAFVLATTRYTAHDDGPSPVRRQVMPVITQGTGAKV